VSAYGIVPAAWTPCGG